MAPPRQGPDLDPGAARLLGAAARRSCAEGIGASTADLLVAQ